MSRRSRRDPMSRLGNGDGSVGRERCVAIIRAVPRFCSTCCFVGAFRCLRFSKICLHSGKPIYDESGELVCTAPFPSQPTHFWNDPDGDKYRKAYFEKFDGESTPICTYTLLIIICPFFSVGVWAHGDFCLISLNSYGVWMHGRSDGTLNPNGVRFGSAEIYAVGG